MAAASAPTYKDILRQAQSGRDLAPVYILHGEEGFYTDRLVEAFTELVPEADRDFNLYTLYGPQTDAATIHEICRRYPMMADRQVVIVREMQAMKATEIAKLAPYLSAPSATTVLVLAFRGDKAKGKDMLDAAKKSGAVFFESKKLKDSNVAAEIANIIKEKGLNIEPRGLQILRDYIGADLSKIYSEIEKLTVALEPGAMITPEVIEANIGISKAYNTYEFVDAIAVRDAKKAYTILGAFRKNPKLVAWPQVLHALFYLFADITCYHFTRNKTPEGLAQSFPGKSPWALRKVSDAARMYNARQVVDIISAIREADAHSKGIGSRFDGWDILHDLVFKILNTRGI